MRRNQALLGTYVEICIEEDENSTPQQKHFYQEIGNVIFREISKVQALMSVHDCDSDISRINRLSKINKSIICSVHPWTYELIHIAQIMCDNTNGYFDCCVEQCSLSKDACHCINEHSSIQSIQLLGKNEIRISEPIRIDFGGIAKGYAVDRGIEILKNFGIENGMINAGGDLRVIGGRSQAIYLKEKEYGNTFIFLGNLKDGAIATTASRFGKVSKNRRMSYLINPKTGECIEDDLSYSIVAPTCVVADGLTKALAIEKNIQASYFQKFGAIPIIVE
jgi:thiamine biosynthesis lipoprotein